jgi:hypothetical protein
MLADLEAETEAGRAAIKMRYEKEAEAEDARRQSTCRRTDREQEELEERYQAKKAQLESLTKVHLSLKLISVTSQKNTKNFEVGMGGTALKAMLDAIDLETLIAQLTEEVEGAKGQREKKLLKRLKVLEGMQAAGIKPSRASA